ncbi:MAG: TauD/TfdA family dioxygenase [Betaproteobacteria bacterium]|nr:TauD/TfdA family dioxygenase [Betaproteobacteria bacterium]MBT5670910.1 TauD/TfdA family dioxygenase [Betaproteobacteria bacterium]
MLLKIRELTPKLGAEVLDLDLSHKLNKKVLEDIQQLFLKYQILYFGQQKLSSSAHVQFGQQFGELQVHVMNQYHQSKYPELYRLSNIGEDGKANGIFPDQGTHVWHTDASWQERTGQATIIYCELAAQNGGNTLFCDMYGAYDRLPQEWKIKIEDKRANHSLHFSRNRRHGHQPMTNQQRHSTPVVNHPIVRTHPDTQKKAMFLGDHAESVLGVPYDTGRLWIDELNQLIVHDELTYEHRWKKGDLLVWDNRCLMHRVTSYDASKEGRIIRRCTAIDPIKPY